VTWLAYRYERAIALGGPRAGISVSLGVLAVCQFLTACATSIAIDDAQDAMLARSLIKDAGALQVAAALPTAAEVSQIYGVDLTGLGVQPVWIEVSNASEEVFWLVEAGIDPNAFSPAEVAYAIDGDAVEQPLLERAEALQFRNPIRPGDAQSGFVLTNLDEGSKVVDVDLVAAGDVASVSFTLVDPDFDGHTARAMADVAETDDALIEVEDERELQTLLAALPCCASNKAGSPEGDPLNIVLIGAREEIVAAGLRRGWEPTERLTASSIIRTVEAFLTGQRYRYSPISPLYLFGRPQDVAAQKVRGSIHERNHLRLWLSPIRFRGEEVWVGQISRDIGVKFTFKSPTISTHVIDPDVDEARNYLVEDMAFAQALDKFGYVGGVGPAPRSAPRENLVGDPYFTDGRRAVMFVGAYPRALDEIDWLFQDLATPALRGENP